MLLVKDELLNTNFDLVRLQVSLVFFNYREPLDRLEHPDYYRMVDTPMDLGTMREELQGNNYESPEDFCEDLRRIFTNSKNYSTDKRSRVFVHQSLLFM